MIGWYDAESNHPNEVGAVVAVMTLDGWGKPEIVKAVWNGERFDHGNATKVFYWRWLREGE